MIIEGDELRHLKVLRLRSGDRVQLFDGTGQEVEAELRSVAADRAEARICRRLRRDVEPALEAWLLQAVPARIQRLDLVVRQGTELGMSRLLPVISERSQLSAGRLRGLDRQASRWRRIAREAAKQCGRGRVPVIEDPVAWDELDWQRIPPVRLLLQPGGGEGELGRLVAGSPAVALLVGPEGGFSEAENDRARERGAVPLGLGPRTLRTDTAGAAALALALYEAGDLG